MRRSRQTVLGASFLFVCACACACVCACVCVRACVLQMVCEDNIGMCKGQRAALFIFPVCVCLCAKCLSVCKPLHPGYISV